MSRRSVRSVTPRRSANSVPVQDRRLDRSDSIPRIRSVPSIDIAVRSLPNRTVSVLNGSYVPPMNDTTITEQTAADALTWDQATSDCAELGGGAYLATVGADGRPHVAWVSLGYRDERIWFSTFASSQKAHNLRHAPEVALHWPERADRLAFARGTARLVDDRAESDLLWDAGILDYDLADFFGTRDNPDLLFVEITPRRIAFRSLVAPTDPPKVWTPA